MKECGVTENRSARRILFVQYLNPAAYPPIVHACNILAENGAAVRVFGIVQPNTKDLAFEAPESVILELMGPSPSGWRLKPHYLVWLLKSLFKASAWKADVVYASDPFAAPAGYLAALTGRAVVYHEHDAPPLEASSVFERLVLGARRRLGRRARLCVFPGEARLELFQRSVLPTVPCVSVFNCPRLAELPQLQPVGGFGTVLLHYHGSLAGDRLPLAVVSALRDLPETVHLQVIGYEAPSGHGYVEQLVRHATDLGVANRLLLHGPVASRRHMLELAANARIGLLLMTGGPQDPNSATMAGASNKLYEYLAAGLSVIVGATSPLRHPILDLGVGLTCDSGDPAQIAQAIKGLLAKSSIDGDRQKGRARVVNDWNYDVQFAPVVRQLLGSRACASGGRTWPGSADQPSVPRRRDFPIV